MREPIGLSRRRFLPWLGGGALGVASCCAAGSPGGRPNVLFIITDQQFGDTMSCRMGNQLINTPAMDRLARRGTLFSRAYSANPLCVPWRNSAFTGRYPHETGIASNDDIGKKLDQREFTCLGRFFRQGGYEAAYSGKWHFNFDIKDTAAHGFEIVTGSQDPRKGTYDRGVTEGALAFLARPREKPFLLVASYMNPHNICEWARRLAGREQVLSCGEIGDPPPAAELPPVPANLAPQRDEPDSLALLRRGYHASAMFPVGGFTEEDWRRHRWGYYRMVELVDAEIGRLLDALRGAGLEENTVVVFVSDHGECAGAHGWNQKTVFYEESVRVPLIIAAKGTDGGVSDKLVNTGIDLLPTMLDIAGLAIPEQLPGLSLVPLLRGGEVSSWREYVVAQNHLVQAGMVDGIKPQMEGRMVRTDRYKYCIYSRGARRESLVDMQADPGETANLAGDPAHRDALLRHRALLAQFGKERNDPVAATLLAGISAE